MLTWLRSYWLIALQTGIVIAVALYLLLVTWIEVVHPPVYASKAIAEPLRAARKLLHQHDFAFEIADGISPISIGLQRASVFLLEGDHSLKSDNAPEDLRNWVRTGGTLIYRPITIYGNDEETRDLVLELFNLHLIPNLNFRPNYTTPPAYLHHLHVKCPTAFELPIEQLGTYEITLSNRLLLKDASVAEGSPAQRAFTTSVGRGQVLVLPNLSLWRNNLIPCHDNAPLLIDLALASEIGLKTFVWYPRNSSGPSVQELLWQWFPESISILGVLLLFWLWNRLFREQFIQDKPVGSIDSLETYLMRRAAFRWRKSLDLTPLQPLRKEITGNLHGTSINEKCTLLATKSSMSVNEIEKALTADEYSKPRDLIQIVAVLNSLRSIK